ncbi:MAG: hypothetical protein NTW16_08850 [Bacteroidetes bacterium]|nr:hypothetical protein [Bacteroidota bacterium]
MSTVELQNKLIRKILGIRNQDLLEYLFSIAGNEKGPPYQPTPFELRFIKESMKDYPVGKVISNEDVFTKTDQWLKE